MYNASPRNIERYCLRLPLLHNKSCTDWPDIRTYNGIVHDTYKEAAIARGLLQSDRCWEETLEEARVFRMPSQLRALFAIISSFGEVTNALQLSEVFRQDMIADKTHECFDEERATNLALTYIRDQLVQLHC